ncbi:BCCT family transporter [Sphaerimonospora mesophila]|uniref:BCCT family transporter n=1 Tax=Sphaerimonospora mesophila TaxID=37483 RepID=UPI0006E42896
MSKTSPTSIDRPLFLISAGLAAAFVAWGVFATDNLATVAGTAKDFVIEGFGWVFILTSAGFVFLAVALAISRYGRIRLGKDSDRPEFRTSSWVAMMFSAGMGIGLMFYGVAEPLNHLATPPLGLAEPGSKEAARLATEYSYFHWAIHPWAMYAVVGLALAYSAFRKGRASLISSAFFPLLGDRTRGGAGRAADIFAIIATLFGSATSLGLGALQINSGLTQLWGFPKSTPLAIGIIAALTTAFVISAVTGVRRGIQWLSNTNMVLAILLLAFLFVVGPTVFVLNTFTESVGGYLGDLLPMSFRSGAFGGADWLSAWTIFYWAWWISWTPFVGMFIARISKGRTIREFVVGVILIPSLVSFVWFAILGGSALHVELSGKADLAAAAAEGPEFALFGLLREYPMFAVMAVLVMVLVALFFVSGADAASVVMGTLSSRGVLEPGRGVVILWGTATGMVAAVLLLAGGLDALQTLCILAAAPFLLVICGMCAGLIKDLRQEPKAAAAEPASPGRAPESPAETQTLPV